jgi:enoyl-CoA hydratase/carnithine racemase
MVTSPSDTVVVDFEDGLLRVTLNRPERRNALIPEVTDALAAVFEQAAEDHDVRLALIAGNGISFCAGGDATFKSADFATGWASFERAVRAIHSFPHVIVTRAQGHAIGAGCVFALLADFVVAADDTRFHFPFVHMGLVPEGMFLITRLIRPVDARRFALLGEPIEGRRAAEIGLIHASVPALELDDAVAALVAQLRALPHWSIDKIKEGLRLAEEATVDECLAWEQRAQGDIRAAAWYEEYRVQYFERLGVKTGSATSGNA